MDTVNEFMMYLYTYLIPREYNLAISLFVVLYINER